VTPLNETPLNHVEAALLMGFELRPETQVGLGLLAEEGSCHVHLRVSIDYELPDGVITSVLGRLLGGWVWQVVYRTNDRGRESRGPERACRLTVARCAVEVGRPAGPPAASTSVSATEALPAARRP
jgi:hypothetical protein